MPLFSIVLAISGNDASRTRNFVAVLDCFRRQTFSRYELVVVEQCIGGQYHKELVEGRGYRYIPIYGEPFSLSWCWNLGTKNTSGPVLIYMVADCVFGEDFLDVMFANFNGCYAAGWSELISLNKPGTAEYFSQIPSKWSTMIEVLDVPEYKLRRNREPNIDGTFGVATIIDRWLVVEKLAGFNENFVNWGGEDVDFAHRARAATGVDPMIIDYRTMHLFHPWRLPGSDFQSKILFIATVRWPDEVSRRLLEANLGQLESRTEIDVSDLTAKVQSA